MAKEQIAFIYLSDFHPRNAPMTSILDLLALLC